MNDNTFQLFPTQYKVPCHTHQCHGRAAYYIGRPSQKHTGTLQLLCENCANELIENIISNHQQVEVNADPLPVTISADKIVTGTISVGTISASDIFAGKLPFEPPAGEIEVIEIDGKLITDMTVKELKAVCKNLGITGYSDKKEKELIAMIEKATDELALEAYEKGEIE